MGSKDHPFIFHFFTAKVNQETQLDARAAQFIQKLRLVGGLIGGVGLEFDNDFSFKQ